jgi:plasmid replication initiation protein
MTAEIYENRDLEQQIKMTDVDISAACKASWTHGSEYRWGTASLIWLASGEAVSFGMFPSGSRSAE